MTTAQPFHKNPHSRHSGITQRISNKTSGEIIGKIEREDPCEDPAESQSEDSAESQSEDSVESQSEDSVGRPAERSAERSGRKIRAKIRRKSRLEKQNYIPPQVPFLTHLWRNISFYSAISIFFYIFVAEYKD